MAFDGITLHTLITEMNTLVGGKVNSVHQPTKNSITMSIYAGKTYMLNIDTSASNYRIHLSTHSKSNPIKAPNFCMVLRKYLIGGKIQKIYMNDLERICYIEFDCFNEMNDKVTRTLVVELMGKYSNIILLNEKDFIIDAMKKFDVSDSFASEGSVSRSIMPARKYFTPANLKNSIFDTDLAKFESIISKSDYNSLDKAIPTLFTGISKMFIQSAISYLHITNNIGRKNISVIYDYIMNVLRNSNNVFCNEFNGNYSVYYDNQVNNEDFQVNFYIDNYYFEKDEQEFFTNYRNQLLKVLSSTLDKLTTKLKNINEKIYSCKNMDIYKTYGELLIANIYRLNNTHDNYVEIENYYSSENEVVKIDINPNLTISQNAEKYFKKYNKMKNTLRIVSIQKKETEQELESLENLVNMLDDCNSLDSVDNIYETISTNILFNDIKFKQRNVKKMKQDKNSLTNYMKLKIDSFDVYIGKNNKQNDYLSTKVANPNDYWFHAKDIHGSHLILRCNGEMPKLQTIKQCAKLAAHYSKAKFSSHVPVDYTLAKYVKKPNGSIPGYVIYTNNKTIYVNP